MVNEELKVGTKLRTSEQGLFVYIINAINTIPAKNLKLYYVEVVPGQGAMDITPIWLDETALRAYYPVIVGAASVAASDLPGSDVAGAVGDAAPTVRMQVYAEPVLGKTHLEGPLEAARLELAGLHSYLKQVGASISVLERVERALGMLVAPYPEPEPEKPHEVLHNWDGCECPYCHSGNIEAGKNDWEGDTAWQRVECLDCGKEWSEVYWLVFADDIDDTQNILAYTDLGDLLLVMPEVRKKLLDLQKEMEAFTCPDAWRNMVGQIIDMIPTELIERSTLGSQS